MQDLLDTAIGLKKFISFSELEDPDFLQDFIRAEHVSGVIVFDSDLSPVAQADMDHKDTYPLWSRVISRVSIKNILLYPQKTYIDHITLNSVPYDRAVVADDQGQQLILCYSSTKKPTSDPYELTIKDVLVNNNFYRNPTLVITDGTQVLSTNSTIVDELGTSQYQQFDSTIH